VVGGWTEKVVMSGRHCRNPVFVLRCLCVGFGAMELCLRTDFWAYSPFELGRLDGDSNGKSKFYFR
jgi:hypothetical protein